MRLTGRPDEDVELTRAYCQAQGLWRDNASPEPVFTDTLDLDMSTIEPSLAGPKRPQDRVLLTDVDDQFNAELEQTYKKHNDPRVAAGRRAVRCRQRRRRHRRDHQLHQYVEPVSPRRCGAGGEEGAGEGAASQPWVKTSLAPGSQVVTDYLKASGLEEDLDAMGFDLVGYGCTTCIGNSGPLAEPISKAINENDLVAVSVLSATAISRGGCRRIAAPTISPRRRWWSPMR